MLLAMLRCYMSNAGCMMQKTPVTVGPGLETAKHILMLVRVRTSGRWLMPAKQSQFGCQHLAPFPWATHILGFSFVREDGPVPSACIDVYGAFKRRLQVS